MTRFAAMTKFLGVALLLAAAFGASPILAEDECLMACEDQYAQGEQACLDVYDQTLADLQARDEACLALPLEEQDACTKAVERERHQAKGDYKLCLAKARVDYNRCRHECSTSPSVP